LAPSHGVARSELLPEVSPLWWLCTGVGPGKAFFNKRAGASGVGDLARFSNLGGARDGKAPRCVVPWDDGADDVYGEVHQRRHDQAGAIFGRKEVHSVLWYVMRLGIFALLASVPSKRIFHDFRTSSHTYPAPNGSPRR
jgi:hypothetical protein